MLLVELLLYWDATVIAVRGMCRPMVLLNLKIADVNEDENCDNYEI